MKQRLRILLVDDDEVDRLAVRRMLRRIQQDLRVDEAPNLVSGVEALAKTQYDCAIIDYRLPDGDGVTFTKEANSQEKPAPPIIMLTGKGDRDIDLAVMAVGASDYLEKDGLSVNTLERAIRHAIAHKQTEKELRRQAIHDHLTGLYNRRYFTDRLETEMDSSKRYGFPLSLCLCDLDGLKTINDSYGHGIGDDVLGRFGNLLIEEVRSGDIAARYGGDEFIILFLHTMATGAVVVLERIRRRFEKMVFLTEDGKKLSPSASFGIVDLSLQDTNGKEFIESADQALYRAKKSGRNRIMIIERERLSETSEIVKNDVV